MEVPPSPWPPLPLTSSIKEILEKYRQIKNYIWFIHIIFAVGLVNKILQFLVLTLLWKNADF